MKKQILSLLKCPNSRLHGLKAYGIEVRRNNNLLSNAGNESLKDDDEIVSGILINEQDGFVYPVHESIAILLAHADVDSFHHVPLLESLREQCPENFRKFFDNTLLQIKQNSSTADGTWNRDEMRYYDADVETEEKRERMSEQIRTQPVHRILIPRKWHITQILSNAGQQSVVLEIGCGNANSMFNIFRPSQNNFSYVGSDISFKRLLVAKMLIPEGDFIQASALNLPFVDESFSGVISFGMLHHLPRPAEAVSQVIPLIQKGGHFGFHEPVIRPVVKFPGKELLKKITATYEHSAHDGKIDLPVIFKLLQDAGFKIVHQAQQISWIRSVTETVLKKINRKILLNKNAVLFLEKNDKIILNLLNKNSGKAIFAVLQKSTR